MDRRCGHWTRYADLRWRCRPARVVARRSTHRLLGKQQGAAGLRSPPREERPSLSRPTPQPTGRRSGRPTAAGWTSPAIEAADRMSGASRLAQNGTASGTPQPVTRSLAGVGYARLASDGSRISLVVRAGRTSCLSPRSTRPRVASAPGPLSAALRSDGAHHRPLPTGSRGTARGAQEDIVGDAGGWFRNHAPDGRRTEGPQPDAGAGWKPRSIHVDPHRLLELWSARRDGSDLRQMTDFKSNVYEAVWSSDGKRAITSDTSPTRSPTSPGQSAGCSRPAAWRRATTPS